MSVSGGDVILASDINKRIPLRDQMTADAAAVSSTTLVTMLTLTLPWVGTYNWNLQTQYTNLTNTGRIGFALGGTSTPSAWRWGSGNVQYNATAGGQGINDSGTSYPGSTSGTALVNLDLAGSSGFCWANISGTVTVSAVGTLTFRFSRTAGTSSINIKKGSMVVALFEG